MKTLREKAKELSTPRGPRCTVCSLDPPMLKSVRALRAEGFRYTTIAATLRTQGLAFTGAVVAHHFRDHEQPNR